MISRNTGWYLHASKLERGDDQHCHPCKDIRDTKGEEMVGAHSPFRWAIFPLNNLKLSVKCSIYFTDYPIYIFIHPSIHPSILPSTYLLYPSICPSVYPFTHLFMYVSIIPKLWALPTLYKASFRSSKRQRQNVTENQSPRMKDWDINYWSKKTFQDLN